MDNDTIWEPLPEAQGSGDPSEARNPPPIPWDPNEYSAMVCRSCGRPRVFRRPRVNHSLHLLLSIGTLGLWLPVWGIIILRQIFNPWVCIVCGADQLPDH